MKLAIATDSQRQDGTEDDRLFVQELIRLSIDVDFVVWNSLLVDWSQYHAVLVRSTWDYYKRPEAFQEWLWRLGALGIPMYNSAPLMSWNLNKTYLKEFARGGFPVVPTFWIPRGSEITSSMVWDEARARGWKEIVVKPSISAGSYLTERFTDGTSMDELIHRIFSTTSESLNTQIMVQPVQEEILAEGEYSLIYFAGQFSHSVLKRPAPQEFRIQESFGGSIEGTQPSSEMLKIANRVVKSIGSSPYARVDLVRDKKGSAGCLIMEVELIEPHLYLKWGAQGDGVAARFFANNLKKLMISDS